MLVAYHCASHKSCWPMACCCLPRSSGGAARFRDSQSIERDVSGGVFFLGLLLFTPRCSGTKPYKQEDPVINTAEHMRSTFFNEL
jgi:hypothetical protein